MKINKHVLGVKSILQELMLRPGSIDQVAERTGLSKMTVLSYLNSLHIGPKNLVYISSYMRSKTVGPYTRVFHFGYCMQDVPRPPALSKSTRDYRARILRKQQTVQTATGVKHVLI